MMSPDTEEAMKTPALMFTYVYRSPVAKKEEERQSEADELVSVPIGSIR